MADWNDIDDSELISGQPLNTSLFSRLARNPEAIAMGAEGAPRIRARAAAQPADLPVLTVTASDAHPVTSANLGLIETTFGGNPLGTLGMAYSYKILKLTGSLRFRIAHRDNTGGANGGGQGAFLSLYKNGTEVASWSTYSNVLVGRSADLSVAIGDVIEWWHRSTYPSNNNSYLQGHAVYASDAYTTRNFWDVASNLI